MQRSEPAGDRWQWYGGRPSLDLVNTVRERWAGGVETLHEPGDLAAWLVAAGLAGDLMLVPRAVVQEARELRDAIDAAVQALVDGVPVPGAAVTLVDDWLVHAGTRPQLGVVAGLPVLGERVPADSPRRALGMVALDAAMLLGDPAQRARLRICASETCGARFYDRSPAARRRWCSMTTCGNVAKARRHRARRTVP
jgi:predicted RNA-binding Zn ribbon-like protein